jgi:hypothetical protein
VQRPGPTRTGDTTSLISGRARAGFAIVLVLAVVGCTSGGLPECDGPTGDADACGTPSAPSSPTPSRSTVFRAWAPANEREAAFSLQDAVRAGARFDLLVLSPSVDTELIEEMRRVQPRSRLLVYMNAAFAQARDSQTYPDEWYARDADGSKISSVGFGNWLMDVTVRGWARDRARTCMHLIAEAGYDGCMLDLLGTAPLLPGYATGIPIDERTGEPWRPEDWLEATSKIAGIVERRVRPAIVIGNGLGNGRRFFDAAAPSSILLAGIHGGVAEGWLRPAREELDRYPSVDDWLLDVRMLSSAGGDGKTVLVLTKTWTAGSRQEKDRWHLFSLASFLLGMEGSSFFHFSYSPRSDPIRSPARWDPDIGRSIESFRVIDGVYRRRFARGLVVVNPSDVSVAVSLPGSFTTLNGVRVQGAMTMQPHSGEILRTDGP